MYVIATTSQHCHDRICGGRPVADVMHDNKFEAMEEGNIR
jgi:hypothetical protein